jgi:hypothetical protein
MNMDLQTNKMFTVDLNALESMDGYSEFQGQAGVGEGAYLGYRASVLPDNTYGIRKLLVNAAINNIPCRVAIEPLMVSLSPNWPNCQIMSLYRSLGHEQLFFNQ